MWQSNGSMITGADDPSALDKGSPDSWIRTYLPDSFPSFG
jgi:hypothetical protein